MTLAFSLGLTLGYRRTLWMMVGELVGVAVVVSASLALIVWVVSLDPLYLRALTVLGGAYLLWIAWQLWNAHDRFQRTAVGSQVSAPSLVLLGFATAVMNPKGWAFFLAMLPGFLDLDREVLPQLALFLGIMLSIEFFSMSLYASGGRWLGQVWGRSRTSLFSTGSPRC